MSLFIQYNYKRTNVTVILGAKPINSVNLGHVHAHTHNLTRTQPLNPD